MSETTNFVRKASPFLIASISSLLLLLIGLLLINNGLLMAIFRDIPRQICIVISRVLTLNFGELPYGGKYWFSVCKSFYDLIGNLKPLINGIARLGVLLVAFYGGVMGFNLTKSNLHKK